MSCIPSTWKTFSNPCLAETSSIVVGKWFARHPWSVWVCLALKLWNNSNGWYNALIPKTALFVFDRDLNLTSARHKSGESFCRLDLLQQVNVNKKEFVFLPTECRIQPLGMENREMSNEAVKASSSFDPTSQPWQVRLNNIQTSGRAGHWASG